MDSEEEMEQVFEQMERESYTIRKIFRFAETPGGEYGKDRISRIYYKQASPTEGEINLNLFKEYDQIVSYIAIGENGLWFEFFEQSPKEQRTQTREALEWLSEFLTELRKYEQEISEKGTAVELLPDNYFRTGESAFEVEWRNGEYIVKGWINPGGQGCSYLKIYDIGNQRHLTEREFSGVDKEYLGWNSNSKNLFWYRNDINLSYETVKRTFDGIVELWFHSSKDDSEKKLLEKQYRFISLDSRTIDITRKGRVTDLQGRPLSGAEVILYGVQEIIDEKKLPYECEIISTTITDERGSFELTYKEPYMRRPFEDSDNKRVDYEDLFIVAKNRGYSVGAAHFDKYTDEQVVIQLDIPAFIGGVVIDVDGRPIEGAEVHVFPIKEVWEDSSIIALLCSTDLCETITDSQGRFGFNNIPSKSGCEFVVSADGYLDKYTWDYIGGRTGSEDGRFEAGAPDVLITMQVKSTISGTIIDKETDKGIENIEIVFSGKGLDDSESYRFETTTDKDGKYSLDVVGGRYVLGYASPYKAIGGQSFVVNKGESLSNIDIYVHRQGRVCIQIRQKGTGIPVQGAHILIGVADGGMGYGFTTEEDGDCYFRCWPGEYFITEISKEGTNLLNEPKAFVIEPGKESELKFEFDVSAEPERIIAELVDSQGNFIQDAKLFIFPGNIYIAQSDRQGQVEIPADIFERAVEKLTSEGNKKEGEYSIYDHFYLFAQLTEDNLGGFSEIRHTFRGVKTIVLDEAFDVKGRVLEVTGEPISGVRVSTRLRTEWMVYEEIGEITETDDNGFYYINCLPYHGPGGYVISAAGESFGQMNVKVYPSLRDNEKSIAVYELSSFNLDDSGDIFAFETEEDIVTLGDYELKRADLSYSYYVFDTLGRPRRDIEFYIEGEGQPEMKPLSSRDDGYLSFDGLCEGDILLKCRESYNEYLFEEDVDYFPFKLNMEPGQTVSFIILPLEEALQERPEKIPEDKGLVEIHIKDISNEEAIRNAAVIISGEKLANKVELKTNNTGDAYVVLPEGEYVIEKVGGRIDYLAKNTNELIIVRPDKYCQFETGLEKRIGYAGIVLDDYGMPVGNARLKLFFASMNQKEVYTDGNGRFQFTFKPEYLGNPWLYVEHERRNLAGVYEIKEKSGADLNISVKEVPFIETQDEFFPYILNENNEWILENDVRPSGWLNIEVFNSFTTQRLPGAEVHVSFNEGKGYYVGITDKEGVAKLSILWKGDYKVEKITAEGYQDLEPGRVVEAGGSNMSIFFHLTEIKRSIKALVLDINNVPLAKAEVTNLARVNGRWRTDSARTDSNGVAVLNWERHTPGRPVEIPHILIVNNFRGSKTIAAKSWLSDGLEEDIIIEEEPRQAITGRVVDINGNSIGEVGMSVYLGDTSFYCELEKTDSDGYFIFDPLPKGFNYKISCRPVDTRYKSKTVFVNIPMNDELLCELGNIVCELR